MGPFSNLLIQNQTEKNMKSTLLHLFVLVISPLVIVCGGSKDNNPIAPSANTGFANPRKVTLVGYTGDAMEPFISRDGNILFFNNLNSASLSYGDNNDTNIHYAVRIDDVTFEYMGKVTGASTDETPETNELEGVASMDEQNKFYFISTLDYLDQNSPNYLSSIFQAEYVNGSLLNIKSLPNLKNDRPSNQAAVPGELNFDAEIHYAGDILYFVEGIFSGKAFPDEADIGVAENVDGLFVVKEGSSDELALINSDALEYAPSISSDMLELYFTRLSGSLASGFDFGIYIATRPSISKAWSNISKIEAISGDTIEAPSLSFDGKRLYYHQKDSNVFQIYLVERE